MRIDRERPEACGAVDPFACPPIDIMETLDSATGLVRDALLADREIMRTTGRASCRVVATAVTPRMRQLLATMGWVPLDPASDRRWILDEPVNLPSNANASVAEATAEAHANGMKLLFSPADGMFEGVGCDVSDGGDATPKASRAEVKLLAERRWVSCSIVSRICPATILHRWTRIDVERVNSARLRHGLSGLPVPSISTVQRWCREFDAVHADRDGLGRRWRNYRPIGDG